MFRPSTTIFRNPENNNLYNPKGKQAGKEIVSLGKTNQKLLRNWANEKYNKKYKVITQFQKEFKLKNPADTYNYLKTQYNNDLRNRITEQKQYDKDSKNREITELKQKAKEQKKSLFIQEVTIEFLKRQKDSLEPFIKAKYSTTAYANKRNKLDENIRHMIKVGKEQLEQDSPTEIIITESDSPGPSRRRRRRRGITAGAEPAGGRENPTPKPLFFGAKINLKIDIP
jgi:hypothetical protein